MVNKIVVTLVVLIILVVVVIGYLQVKKVLEGREVSKTLSPGGERPIGPIATKSVDVNTERELLSEIDKLVEKQLK